MTIFKSAFLATCLTLPALLPTPASAGTDPAQPNILLIIADDMGLDASRCYNVANQQANMPVLEKMCEEGMVFNNAYSAPVCSPTRATIMTGKYGFRTGIGAAIPKEGGEGLSVDETSLFDVMATTNYSSALIGKWHLGSDTNLDKPAQLGVPHYSGIFGGGTPNYYKWRGVENGKTYQSDTYTTTDFTNKALDWIGAQAGKPWFLWLAYNAPHTPFHVPPADLANVDGLIDDPDAIKENPLPYYNAMLEALDTEIGRLLKTMPQDERANTYVMFVGDNGTPGQVAREIYQERGAKGSIYEGGNHVPLVVTGPNVASGRNDALVNTTDFYATIAELAGAKSEAPDSISFTKAFDNSASARPHVYVEHFSGPEIEDKKSDKMGWAMRDGQYKLVAQDGKERMLFDLETDGLERSNLLEDASSDILAKATELTAAYKQIKQ